MEPVRIEVLGPHARPEPAGSKTAFPLKGKNGWLKGEGGRPIINVVDANPKAKAWKMEVAEEAAKQYRAQLIDRPVRCFMTFYLQRPKGHYGTGKNERVLKDSSPLHHTKAPDALKLARGVEDALTGVVWVDDAQVHRGGQRKVYVHPWEDQGVVVEVQVEEQVTVGDARGAAQTTLLG